VVDGEDKPGGGSRQDQGDDNLPPAGYVETSFCAGLWTDGTRFWHPKGRPDSKRELERRRAAVAEAINRRKHPATAPADEEMGAPTVDALKYRAGLLREANPRIRHRGQKGDALRQLTEIERSLDEGSLSPRERAEVDTALDRLAGGFGVRAGGHAVCSYCGPGPLGADPFAWRNRGRPDGSKGYANLDGQILIEARKIEAEKGSLGAALRQIIKEYIADGRLPKSNAAETHIQRLRRLVKRMGLQQN